MKLVPAFVLLVTFTGCKDTKNTAPAAKPIAEAPIVKPPGTDTRLRLAIAIPVTSKSSYVPNAQITAEEPITLEAYKADLGEDDHPTTAALTDGWAVRLPDGELARSIVQRTLGGHTYRCESEGQDQTAHDLGRASCLAMTLVGGVLLVPFAMPAEDSAGIGIDTLSLDVARVDADTPASAEAMLENTGWRKTGKLLRGERTADGFIAIVEGHSGDLATNKVMFDAMLRSRVDGLELACGPWSSASSAEVATQIVETCRGLRAY